MPGQNCAQWFSTANSSFGASPYMTTAVSADAPIKVKDDVVGVGLFLANDQAGANTFSTIMVCASASYIKTLGKKKNHHISAGFQLGITNTSINSSGFQFASQFQDNIFNSSLANNESIGKTHVTYPNINAGLLWYGRLSDVIGIYAGGSLFNLYQPKYDVLTGDNNNLYLRWNVNAGIDITIDKKYHLLPSLMYQRQSVDNEMNTGLGFGIDFNEDATLTLGLYNRINTLSGGGAGGDAIIPYLAIEYRGFKLGMSYDATISQLKNAGSAVGAIELSLSYTGKRKNYNYKSALICPRF